MCLGLWATSGLVTTLQERWPNFGAYSVLSGHHPIDVYEQKGLLEKHGMLDKNKKLLFVGFLRDPYLRLVSGYHHNLHDCPKCGTGISLEDYTRHVHST